MKRACSQDRANALVPVLILCIGALRIERELLDWRAKTARVAFINCNVVPVGETLQEKPSL